MCGLKLSSCLASRSESESHPSWVCGLKLLECRIALGSLDVTPFVGVWIETLVAGVFKYTPMSHPSWVCGLKPQLVFNSNQAIKSHPSWVCGLKLSQGCSECLFPWSHPSWVCGLKHNNPFWLQAIYRVTPFVGVWIETM